MKPRGIIFDILVGLPGGALTFMGMLMFNAVLGIFMQSSPWGMLGLLCFTSLVVGVLARLMRPFHWLGTAIASGVTAAVIILYLRLFSNTETMRVVFGPAGMLATIAFTLLGAWAFPYVRNYLKT
jgi:hypothetical protein